MNTIYIEAFSGLSGNMFLSAFCELLDDYHIILDLPRKLHIPDAKIEITQVDKNGINCNYIEVIDLNENDDDDHKSQHHTSGHSHTHKHSHEDAHTHSHSNHRHLKDILAIIDHAHINENAKNIAKEIFLIIGKAESKIHDMPLETIHFHEISGVDSIIDIVGNAVLIDKLNISKAVCTPVCTGYGMVKTQHGMLPVPAPATAEILKQIPTYAGNEEGEKVTPTGAAILKFLNPNFNSNKTYTNDKIAYGPGKKDFQNPNVVRISMLSKKTINISDKYIQMETSIDDMSPEFLGTDFQEGLLKSGALDFSISHEVMKKGRFGIILKIILKKKHITQVSNYVFDNTTTIGVRYFNIERIELQREVIQKNTKVGNVNFKKTVTPNGMIKEKAEYEDIANLSFKLKKPALQIKKEIN